LSYDCVVTGAGGFVGAALTNALTNRGYRVRALLRKTDLQSPAPTPGRAMMTEHVVGDLTQACPQALASLLAGADTVFHLAARTHMMNASPQAYERINVDVTRQLAIAAVNAGVKHFVFVSSVKAIGEETDARPFTPDTPERPQDDYGRTKLRAEQCLRDLAERDGLPISLIRPPLIYGVAAPGNLARLIRLVQRGIPLPFAAIDNRRSMLSRENLVELLVTLTETPLNRVVLPADIHLSTPQLIGSIAASLGRSPRLFALPVRGLETFARLTGQGEQIRRLTRSLEIADPWLSAVFGWQAPHRPEVALAAMAHALSGSKPSGPNPAGGQ